MPSVIAKTRLNDNTNYQVRFVSSRKKKGAASMVVLPLNERTGFNITSNYTPPFSQGGLQVGNINFGPIMRVMGIIPLTQFLTTQLWEGNETIDMSMDFTLVAEQDAQKDVMQPFRNLLQFTLPSLYKGILLQSPGSYIRPKSMSAAAKAAGKAIKIAGRKTVGVLHSLEGKATSPVKGSALATLQNAFPIENRLSLHIGRYLYFPEIVITGVLPVWSNLLDDNGIPISMDLTVGIRTFQVPITKDIPTMFP